MRDIDLLRIIKRAAYKIIAKDKDSAVIANDFMNRFKGTDLFLKKFKLGKKETIYLFITNFVKIIYKLILSIGFSINSAIYKKREQNLKKMRY